MPRATSSRLWSSVSLQGGAASAAVGSHGLDDRAAATRMTLTPRTESPLPQTWRQRMSARSPP